MKKLTLGLAVIYAGGDVAAALRAAELAGAPIALDDMMAARLSVARDWPGTVTRVIDDSTVDLELQGVPDGQPRQRFGVKLGTGPNTFRFSGGEAAPSGSASSDKKPREALEEMTVEKLQTVAAEYKVDLTGITKKSDIVDAIQKSAGYKDKSAQ